MAQASSYTKLTELTAEQQAKFKETATILAQGKTATDGATTDINIPFDEFGGGGGGYTVVNLAPSNSELYVDTSKSSNNKSYIINATNNSLIFLDLSGITDSDFEYLDVVLPAITATEYYDIVIQTTAPASAEYKYNVKYPSGTGYDYMIGVDNEWTTANVECHIFGKHFIVTPMMRGGDES